MYRYQADHEPRQAGSSVTRLLNKVRERIRYLHCSFATEEVYLYWVRFFVLWHGRTAPILHPRGRGAKEVENFLTMLAVERKVRLQWWHGEPD